MKVSAVLPLVLAIGLTATAPALAADPRIAPEHRAEVARLIDGGKQFGLDATFRADAQAAIRGYRFPDDFPPALAAKLKAEEAKVQEKSRVPYRETLIDAFAKRLSPENAKAAADFFETPAGRARAEWVQQQIADPNLTGRLFAYDAEVLSAVQAAAAAQGLTVPKPD